MRVPDGLRMTDPEAGRQLEEGWRREGLGGPSHLFQRAKLLFDLLVAAAVGGAALFLNSSSSARSVVDASTNPWVWNLFIAALWIAAAGLATRGYLDWQKTRAPPPPPDGKA